VAVEEAQTSAGRTTAWLVVGVLAVTMAVLPATVALRVAGGVVAGPLMAGLGGLAAVLGGVKLAAAAGGLVAKLLERPWLRAVAGSID